MNDKEINFPSIETNPSVFIIFIFCTFVWSCAAPTNRLLVIFTLKNWWLIICLFFIFEILRKIQSLFHSALDQLAFRINSRIQDKFCDDGDGGDDDENDVGNVDIDDESDDDDDDDDHIDCIIR